MASTTLHPQLSTLHSSCDHVVSPDFPISFVGVSDPATEIVPLRGSVTRVCRPVEITCSGGNPFIMNVSPLNLGGVFSWQPLGCACTLSGIGDTFQFSCSQSCTCCGSSADGEYSYEGYSLFATTCPCGCYYDGTGASWGPSTNYSASVSAAFTKPAVIFEDPYENKPGDLVARRSTRTRLNIVASGGLYGATLSVSATNLTKLCHLSGPALPLAPVSVPSGTSVGYSIVYDGLEASETQDDIAVTATVIENMTGMVSSNECNATSIRLELAAVWEAPENSCTNRHVYGVGEKVRIQVFPEGAATVGLTRIDEYEAYYDNLMDGDAVYVCPVYSASPQLKASCQGVEYIPQMTIVEPESIICRGAAWDTPCLSPGVFGGTMLSLTNYVGPMGVSFHGILMAEVPCVHTDMPTGYFATTYTGRWTHTFIFDDGWSAAMCVGTNNYWTVDRAGHPGPYDNWSEGRLAWGIPIGWFRKRFDDDPYKYIESEEVGMDGRKLLVGGRIDAYQQIFSISTDGTASVEKHGHKMSRGRFCRVILDGKTIQWVH